jgi:SOS-response transcriptional repressor LexA
MKLRGWRKLFHDDLVKWIYEYLARTGKNQTELDAEIASLKKKKVGQVGVSKWLKGTIPSIPNLILLGRVLSKVLDLPRGKLYFANRLSHLQRGPETPIETFDIEGDTAPIALLAYPGDDETRAEKIPYALKFLSSRPDEYYLLKLDKVKWREDVENVETVLVHRGATPQSGHLVVSEAKGELGIFRFVQEGGTKVLAVGRTLFVFEKGDPTFQCHGVVVGAHWFRKPNGTARKARATS